MFFKSEVGLTVNLESIAFCKCSKRQHDICWIPKVLTVRVFQVTLLPQPSQDGPALPLQADQSTVLQDVPHQSPLVHHALLYSLIARVLTLILLHREQLSHTELQNPS